MRFDAWAAKSLAAGSHIVVDGVPGLRLVASKTGKAWIYRYKSGSVLRQIKIGAWPAVPLASAIAKWQEIKDLRDSGHDPALEKRNRLDPLRLAYGRTIRLLCLSLGSGHEGCRCQ